MKRKILIILLFLSIVFMEYELITIVYEKGKDAYKDEISKQKIIDYEMSNRSRYNRENYPLGTAEKAEGRIVVLSIFADEVMFSWDDDFDNNEIKDRCYENLKIAANYITEYADKYGKEIEFIYDWKKDPSLLKKTFFNSHIDIYDAPIKLGQYIDDSIDTTSILDEYNADGVIFMFYFNSRSDFKESPFANAYHEGVEFPYESCVLYNFFGEEPITATVYAHEILHLFGAIDLYKQHTDYNLYDDTYNEIIAIYTNDLMDRTIEDVKSREIKRVISDFDAYYIGWIDNLDLVDKYNLRKNDFLLKGIIDH